MKFEKVMTKIVNLACENVSFINYSMLDLWKCLIQREFRFVKTPSSRLDW